MMNKLIIANWKMNPVLVSSAKEFFKSAQKTAAGLKNVTAVVCPACSHLGVLAGIKPVKNVKLGAQDCHFEKEGAFTGSVSAAQLKNVGAEYVIIGHSERRAAGDTNEIVNAKLKQALTVGLKVVLCIGEKSFDENGQYLKELAVQLEEALAKTPARLAGNLVIAHEPLWAIGNQGQADTPDNFYHNLLFIKKVLSRIFSRQIAELVPILYGGSVSEKNARDFLIVGQADGLLVGRASLVAEKFGKILKIASGQS